ncbi:MAG: hypothetical protein R2873_19590 [Caldilineaceae bacterium]
MAKRHHLRPKHIAPRQHGRIRAGGGNVRAERLLEQRRFLGEVVDVRRGQPIISVAAHVIPAQRINAQKHDIRRASSGGAA